MKTFFIKHKVLRAIFILVCLLILIAAAAMIFLKTWPAFGGKASKADMDDYAKRADNFSDGKFSNTEPFEMIAGDADEDDQILSDKGVEPEGTIPTEQPDYGNKPEGKQVHVTWFGHSSLLLQISGMNILIDPVFSERCSPVSFVGGKRFSRPPVSADDLPQLDLVILSHDHYDHLDYRTLKELDRKTERYIVPLGVENHLKRWDIAADKITNMAWWEETEVNGLTIGCTPARHYSRRSMGDQDATLWASWVFKNEAIQIFESGDTGYGNHFEQIHERYGDFDFALLDCAQYDTRWPSVHMFPEQSVQAAASLGAKTVMPIHWGAFKLAAHPWDDPAQRFTKAGEEDGRTVVTPKIGETMKLEQAADYQQRWWQDIK